MNAWRRLSIPMLALVLALMAGCGARPESGSTPTPGLRTTLPAAGTYGELSPEALNAMLASKDFLIVDVHVPNEGRLAATDVRIPYNQMDVNLDRLPADKNAKIVLYCMSGRMSQVAAERLVVLGYTNVWHLVGGMVAWRAAGLPLLSD